MTYTKSAAGTPTKYGLRITTLVSEEVFEALKKEALKSHRSLSAQAAFMIENQLPKLNDPLLDQLKKFHE